MLNYIWTGLIVAGILTALFYDINDEIKNTNKNGIGIPVEINYDSDNNTIALIKAKDFNSIYEENIKNDLFLKCGLIKNKSNKPVFVRIIIEDETPSVFKKIAEVSGEKNDFTAEIKMYSEYEGIIKAKIIPEKISFIKINAVTNAVIEYAKTAVNICLGLIGIMVLWLGIMKIGEEAGIINILARIMKPVTKFLFPEVPAEHPAMGAMIMNMAANMLGLGNAATPFGLKAMEELDSLNSEKGTATNAMCTFLAINTAGLTLIPATAIAIRAAAGSSNPTIIIGTSLFGAGCATVTGILAAKLFEKFSSGKGFIESVKKINFKRLLTSVISAAIAVFLIIFLIKYLFENNFVNTEKLKSFISIASVSAIPLIIIFFIALGAVKKVKVYEKFIEGAKEGFNVAVKIIPYLVGMLAAIGIFRAGGGMEILINILKPVTDFIGMPAEALPMALMRPLSGSGSMGIMAEIISVHGPDSFLGVLVSTIFGSTETTFYVIAVYFGAVNIKRIRHSLAAGILADIAGIIGALFIVKMLFS